MKFVKFTQPAKYAVLDWYQYVRDNFTYAVYATSFNEAKKIAMKRKKIGLLDDPIILKIEGWCTPAF